jgi:hypothetical protein
MAEAAAQGRLQVAFLTGERGIGKTSLARFARVLAELQVAMHGVHIFLGGVTTLEEMVRRVFDRILKDSVEQPWHERVAGIFGKYVKNVGLFNISIEFAAPEEDLTRLVREFSPSLRAVLAQLKDQKKGLFLVLDEIDDLARTKEFATWLKSLVDEIATSSEQLPLCLVLVGLEGDRQSLVGGHESLARVFELVNIHLWSRDETTQFFRSAFGKVGVEVEEAAARHLAAFAGGFPALAQEIGDATYREDKDRHVTYEDAISGVTLAARSVGTKLLDHQVYDAIRSTSYRSILRKVAGGSGGPIFRRSDLAQGLAKGEQNVVDNFLRRMRELEVIEPYKEGGPGCYRFKNILHALYFFMEAQSAKEPDQRD